MAFLDDLKEKFAKSPAPVTIALMVICCAGSLIGFTTSHAASEFVLLTPMWAGHPWTLLTYPIIYLLSGGISVLFFLCIMSWMYWVGGAAEHDLGWARFLALWAAVTVLPGISMVLGSVVSRSPLLAWGPVVPIGYLTFIWGFRHRTQPVSLFGAIPMNGFWMAIVAVVVIFVEGGSGGPMIAAFACLPLILAYLFAMDKLPGLAYAGPSTRNVYKQSKTAKKREDKYFDDIYKREQERKERERLRKLFENSIDDEK